MSNLDILNTQSDPPLPVKLQMMITGPWISQAIYVAAKLGIADLLKDGPQNTTELAKATETHEPSLYRVLRALASLEIFAEVGDRQFALTPLAEFLQTGVPGSLRGWAVLFGEDWHRRPWGDILYSVRTGKTGFQHVFGMEAFDYFAQNPEAAKIFDEAMTSVSGGINPAVAASYDFSQFHQLVDVGGGNGSLIATVLKANPNLQGILVDLAHVLERAQPLLQAEGVTERCQLQSGSFFDSVPSGGDAYMLKSIIHDWDDERALTILKNCHRAMAAHSKLLLIEAVLPVGNEPNLGKFIDLEMLVMAPGGRERTEAEFRSLFAAAGFQLTRIVPTPSPLCVIEGTKLP